MQEQDKHVTEDELESNRHSEEYGADDVDIVRCTRDTKMRVTNTHSLTPSLTQSLLRSFTHSLLHSFTHSHTHTLTHLHTYSHTHTLTHSHTRVRASSLFAISTLQRAKEINPFLQVRTLGSIW